VVAPPPVMALPAGGGEAMLEVLVIVDGFAVLVSTLPAAPMVGTTPSAAVTVRLVIAG
jgi:hypothetical protein